MTSTFRRLIGDKAPARIVAALAAVEIDGDPFIDVDVDEPLTIAAARDLVAALTDWLADADADTAETEDSTTAEPATYPCPGCGGEHELEPIVDALVEQVAGSVPAVRRLLDRADVRDGLRRAVLANVGSPIGVINLGEILAAAALRP